MTPDSTVTATHPAWFAATPVSKDQQYDQSLQVHRCRKPRRPGDERRQADDHQLSRPLLVLEDFIAEDHVTGTRCNGEVHRGLPAAGIAWPTAGRSYFIF